MKLETTTIFSVPAVLRASRRDPRTRSLPVYEVSRRETREGGDGPERAKSEEEVSGNKDVIESLRISSPFPYHPHPSVDSRCRREGNVQL